MTKLSEFGKRRQNFKFKNFTQQKLFLVQICDKKLEEESFVLFKNEEGEVLGWTEKQRQWFLRRDENTCQFVDFSGGRAKNCFNTSNLHIHFIVPPRFGLKNGFEEKDLINPLNGIAICSFHHLNFIHLDIGVLAKRWYRFDQNSYQIILKWHEILAQSQTPYWNTTWDEVLKLIAKIRTREYLRTHPDDPFPQ